MSISDEQTRATEFDRWVAAKVAQSGAFTTLVVLLEIGAQQVTPLCSTYFNVIGDEIDWQEITVRFAGSGANWDAACFFPVSVRDGALLDNPNARAKLRELEARLDQNWLTLNEGLCFDKLGRQLKIEEIALQ